MTLPLVALFAIALGFLASRGQLLFPSSILGLTAILGATLVSNTVLAALLVVAVLLQAPLGNLGGVPYVQLDEILVPALLLVLALRVFSHNVSGTFSHAGSAVSGRARAINIAVGIYALVIALNYLRSKYLLPSEVVGTKRAFYDYFVALGTYLIFYLLFVSPAMQWQPFLRFVYWSSIVISMVGLATVLLHLPVNFGDLRYSVYDLSSGAVRAGFLETIGIVGIALVVTMKFRFRLPAGILFASALVASGGRTAVVGTVVAVAIYLVITRRSWQLLAISIIALLLAVTVPGIQSSPQVQRLSRLNQTEFAGAGRLLMYDRGLEDFASHPLVGTGIGLPAYVETPEPTVTAFYEAQLEVGGHTTYTSLLKNVGLLGFLPFMAAMVVALLGLIVRVRFESDSLSAFFVVLLLAEIVSMLASGNGSDPVYFFALAGGSAVLASRRQIVGSKADSSGTRLQRSPTPAGRLLPSADGYQR
jgi:O-Antigen ligase